jgi:thiol-disulfide isomerase/thioredoxin
MLITVIVALSSLAAASTVELYTHRWCPPCRKAIAVIEKVKKNYPSVTFEEH